MSITTTPDDTALKAKHRAMWALGDYPAVATEVIAELGEVLVDAVGIAAGERVLDIARRLRQRLAPRRPPRRRRRRHRPHPRAARGRPPARPSGRRSRCAGRPRDAEALPYDDAEFDAAISCVGVMFAPHHQVAADELVRVVRPGGRIGLLSWTPAGFIGQMFATMKPYAPPPPPGAQPPPLWGDDDHVRELLGDRVTDLDGASSRRCRCRLLRRRRGVPRLLQAHLRTRPSPSTGRIADDPARTAALDEDLAALGDRYVGAGAMEWEYLLVTARRR